MKNGIPLTQRAPSIGKDFDVKLTYFSNSVDAEPKLSFRFTGAYRVNLLRLAIGVALATASVTSALISVKAKKKH